MATCPWPRIGGIMGARPKKDHAAPKPTKRRAGKPGSGIQFLSEWFTNLKGMHMHATLFPVGSAWSRHFFGSAHTECLRAPFSMFRDVLVGLPIKLSDQLYS